NPHPIRACRAGVHPNVRVGIDHDCLAGLLASDHVARPRQIGVVESSEKHRSPTALVAALLAGRTIVSVLLMHRDPPGNIHHVNSEPSRDSSELTREELVRYSRHILLPSVGEDGQRALKRSRVLLVGAGGLGSPVALYLAAAGVGTIGLVDFDAVDLSNLQRQILHGSSGIGSPKTDSARDRLRDINPNVHVEPYETRFTASNALEIADGHDLIIDGTDNFATRYLVNDTSVLLGIPNVYGSVYRFEVQASVFGPVDGPCYRCLFREPPPPDLIPSCAEAGVLGVVPGLVGTIQETRAVKMPIRLGG